MVSINLIEWKEIAGTDGLYLVSNTGSVYSNYTDRILKPGRAGGSHPKNRYDSVLLYYKTGIKRQVAVHILMAEAFIGPRPEGHMVDHINGDYRDNSLSNLRYVTAQGNSDNTARLNRNAKGERAGGAKLKEADVLEILSTENSVVSCAKLGPRFGVSGSMIHCIRKGVRWKHLRPAEVN